MLSFENWLETRQGKFFQEKIGKEKAIMETPPKGRLFIKWGY